MSIKKIIQFNDMKKIIFCVFLFFSAKIVFCSNRIISMSLSYDAHYLLSVNMDRHAYIWNLKKHAVKKISQYPINVYSAYFIYNTNHYLIQNDTTNEVLIMNAVNNKVEKIIIIDKPVYGEAISSDVSKYVFTDKDYNVYFYDLKSGVRKKIKVSWCIGDHKGKAYAGGLPSNCSVFMGAGMGLKFSNNDQYVIESDMGRLFIFDLKNMLASRYQKNTGFTSNALSPNGKYILTADSNSSGLLYDLENHKIIHDFLHGEKMLDPKQPYPLRPITSVNFITDKAYLVTYSGVSDPIVKMGLYRIDRLQADKLDRGTFYSNQMLKAIDLPVYDPKTHKVLPKLTDRYTQIFPSTESYLPEVATNPKKHLLVMAQANGNGIMVYKYDPKKESLKLLWAPQIK